MLRSNMCLLKNVRLLIIRTASGPGLSVHLVMGGFEGLGLSHLLAVIFWIYFDLEGFVVLSSDCHLGSRRTVSF